MHAGRYSFRENESSERCLQAGCAEQNRLTKVGTMNQYPPKLSLELCSYQTARHHNHLRLVPRSIHPARLTEQKTHIRVAGAAINLAP